MNQPPPPKTGVTDVNKDAEAPPEDERNPEIEEVDPALLAKALADLKNLVRGNGLKPDSITLENFEGEVLNFEADEIFKIDPVISEKHTTGRDQGEVVGSHSDAQQKIKAAIERITRDKELKKQTIAILKKRPDLGFAVPNQIIRLDRFNKKFVTHEPCGPCESSGKIPCAHCHGHKQIVCHRCHGHRDIQCHICQGTQFINTPQGRQQCTQCYGRGRINCDMCRQTGEIPCPKCKSMGQLPCTQCAHTGWHSHVYLMAVKAKAAFDFDRDDLPDGVPPLIEDYGSDLVLDEHVKAEIIEDRRKDEELDQTSKIDEYIIPYHVKLPWGDIAFAVNGKPLKAKLFGYNPLLLELPPILEKTMARGLVALGKAAKGNGDVGKHIETAIRYRAIGEAFLAAIPNPPRKALALLQQKYPYGITEDALKKLVTQAGAAMRQLTRKPRLIGLGLGVTTSAILTVLYFFSPVRNRLIIETAAQFPEPVPDFGIMLLSGSIVTAIIHIYAGKALQRALAPLAKRDNTIKIAPKAEESALWGYAAGAALFLLVAVLATMGGQGPGWLETLLKH